MNNNYYAYESPFGKITIMSDGNAITGVMAGENVKSVGESAGESIKLDGENAASLLTDKAAEQLEEYFAGKRREFDIPLNPHGTDFQLAVWKALQEIPYGETRSYKDIAETIGNPNASRAVGMANNKNPIWIIIPCHRVIGASGALTGYGGGLDMKQKLLDLEALR